MMPFSLSHKKKFFLASGVFFILVIGVLMLAVSATKIGTSEDQDAPEPAAANPSLSIADIESVLVHRGLEIPCPNVQGLAGYGYVYSVQITQGRGIIERVGCGSGTPDIFAQAIAQDLIHQGLFSELPIDGMLEKMSFKFYEPNN